MSNIVPAASEPVVPRRWVPALTYLGMGAGIGAVFGALMAKPCDEARPSAVCGPVDGAWSGAFMGLTITGLVGLAVAVSSRQHRDAGVKIAAVGIGTPIALALASKVLTGVTR